MLKTKFKSNLLDYNYANSAFELIKIMAVIILLGYHVSHIFPFEINNTFLKAILYTSNAGWIGSDILLALSGYLLFSTFYNSKDKQNPGIYLLKKFIRAAIPYYIFLLLYFYLGKLFFDYIGNNWDPAKGLQLSLYTFTTNWFLAHKLSGVALEGMFLLALGTQLVLLFTIILSFFKNIKSIFTVCILLEVFAIIFRLTYPKETFWQFYFSTFTRIDGFVFGILAAIVRNCHQKTHNLKVLSKIHVLISAILLMAIAALTHGLSYFSNLTEKIAYPFIAYFAASIILFSAERGFKNKLIWNLGKSSYFIYLVKIPFAYFVIYSLLKLNINNYYFIILASYIMAIFMLLGLASIWWHLFEKKILSLFFKKY